jgi:transcriptional regulator with XRE-family HTH domain
MRKSIHTDDYAALIELLRESREAAGVTQTDLSRHLGRSQSFVSDVERGQRRLDVIQLRDMCNYIGIEFPAFATELERRLRAAVRPRRQRR